jgi:WD40 repeat protein
VAASAQNTIYIWDITGSDPLLIKTLVGHTGTIISLSFSSPSTLISASQDQSVKFWQIGDLSTYPVANNPKSTPPTSTSIWSVSLQAKHGITISSDLDGVVKMWDISTGLCKASFQTPAAYSFSGAAQMIDGRLIFVWLMDSRIHIWDTDQGKLLHMVDVGFHSGGSLRISGDGSKVFYLVGDLLQAWSTWTGEAVGEVKLENDSYLDPLCVGGSRIQVYPQDKPPQVWDFGIPGSSPILVPNESSEQPLLHFIHGISSLGNGPSRIEDTVTGKDIFQLSGRYANPTHTQWDGQYLVAGYMSGEVLILDFKGLSNDL